MAIGSGGLIVPPPRELLRPWLSVGNFGERFLGVLPSDRGVLLDSFPLLRFDGVEEWFCLTVLFLSDVLSSSELSLML